MGTQTHENDICARAREEKQRKALTDEAAKAVQERVDRGLHLVDELARFMGTSVEHIDKTYGHLLPDSLDRARTALDMFVNNNAARERRQDDEMGRCACVDRADADSLNDAWVLFDDLVKSQNIELLVENLQARSNDALRDIVLQRVLSEQERRRLLPVPSRPEARH